MRRYICIIKILYYLCSEGLTNRLNQDRTK
nr:MAG TPA: hypothetical protein [Caudoviricetes sp.]